MAGPITWRNINAPDFTGSATMMETGSQALQGGLNKLTQLGKDYQARQEQAWEKGTERNRDAVISQIMGLKDMDAYNAFGEQLPGVLDQYGGQIDRKAVMDYWMNRDNDIRTDTTETINFNNVVRTDKESPFTSEVTGMIAQDPSEAAKLLDKYRENGSISEQGAAPLYNLIRQANQENTKFGLETQNLRSQIDERRNKANDAAQQQLFNAISGQIKTKAVEGVADPNDAVNRVSDLAKQYGLPEYRVAELRDEVRDSAEKLLKLPEQAQPILKQQYAEIDAIYDPNITEIENGIAQYDAEISKLNEMYAVDVGDKSKVWSDELKSLHDEMKSVDQEVSYSKLREGSEELAKKVLEIGREQNPEAFEKLSWRDIPPKLIASAIMESGYNWEAIGSNKVETNKALEYLTGNPQQKTERVLDPVMGATTRKAGKLVPAQDSLLMQYLNANDTLHLNKQERDRLSQVLTGTKAAKEAAKQGTLFKLQSQYTIK